MRLGNLAAKLGAKLDGDADIEIDGLAPIDEAGAGRLTFLANPRYRASLATTAASAVIVSQDEATAGRAAFLRAKNPYLAFVKALAIFDRRPRPQPGIHPAAFVHASARLGEGASVGAYAVVGRDVVIGARATIHPHVTIYPEVRIGDDFTAHAGVVVREAVVIGDRVVLQPGAVIGADGFGFVPAAELPVVIPQIGTVELGDDVEVGANAAVDRAAVGSTRVDRGVKIDDLVMVGHGCKVGEASLLAAQTGLAGSSTVGKRAMVGGQAGVGGHVEVGDDVKIAARSGVIADLESGATVGGFPAVAISVWRRYVVLFERLPELLRRLRRLEDGGKD